MIGYIATLCRRLSGMEGFQSLSGEVGINGGQVASGRIDDLLAFSCDGLVCKYILFMENFSMSRVVQRLELDGVSHSCW